MKLTKRNLELLHAASQKPPLYENPKRNMWTDPYVSKHILNAHLDPSSDDASRRPETIKASAGWISDQVGGGAGRRLLDLGCGPGLYCTEFNRLGFDVTGIDFSSHSIEYAQTRADKEGRLISYLCQDYLTTELPRDFDVVTLIFGDFCVLSDRDRDLFLWKLRSVLNPGGFFIFDVFTEAYGDSRRLRTDWYVQTADGFWYPGPHLVLEQCFDYRSADTYLNQYIILTPKREIRKYHIWHHYYDERTISEVLTNHKMSILSINGDLAGAPLDSDGEWMGLVCRCDTSAGDQTGTD